MKYFIPSLEICVVDHCNLSCAQCNHFSPYLKKCFVTPEQIKRDLMRLTTSVTAEEIRIMGGEPLLHDDLKSIVEVVRESGMSNTITVISNGTLIDRMEDKIWNSIDRLWIDRYPGIPVNFDNKSLWKKAQKYNVRLWLRDIEKFRITALNNENSNEKSVNKIYRNCRMAHVWSCAQIRNGIMYKCAVAPYISRKLEKLGIMMNNSICDGYPIHDEGDLKTGIAAYFKDGKPLEACRFCLGTVGKKIKHHQTSKDDVTNELNEDHSDIDSLISWREYWISKIMILLGNSNLIHTAKKLIRYR